MKQKRLILLFIRVWSTCRRDMQFRIAIDGWQKRQILLLHTYHINTAVHTQCICTRNEKAKKYTISVRWNKKRRFILACFVYPCAANLLFVFCVKVFEGGAGGNFFQKVPPFSIPLKNPDFVGKTIDNGTKKVYNECVYHKMRWLYPKMGKKPILKWPVTW